MVDLMEKTAQNVQARKTPNRTHRRVIAGNSNIEASMRITQTLAAAKQESTTASKGVPTIVHSKDVALPPLQAVAANPAAPGSDATPKGLHRSEMNPNRIVGKGGVSSVGASPNAPLNAKRSGLPEPRNSLGEAGRGGSLGTKVPTDGQDPLDFSFTNKAKHQFTPGQKKVKDV